MEHILITIPIEPKGKRVPKRAKRGAFHKMYKDEKQVDYENIIAMYLKEKQPKQPIEGMVKLFIKAHLPIPKSKPKWWKLAAERQLLLPTTKPDCSNVLKNIEDIMKTIQYFHDDAQIVMARCEKFYSNNPCWEIRLEYIPNYQEWFNNLKRSYLKELPY